MIENIASFINVNGLFAATILATVGKALVDFLKAPVEKKGYDVWFAGYIALAFGLIMVALGGINMFNAELIDPKVGIVLTGLYAGGVSVGLNDFLKKRKGDGEDPDAE